MDYRSIDNEVLERHLYADPANLVLVEEAARRLTVKAEGSDEELDVLRAEKDELEREIGTLQEELSLTETTCEETQEELDAAKARIAHLEEVMGLVADV